MSDDYYLLALLWYNFNFIAIFKLYLSIIY